MAVQPLTDPQKLLLQLLSKHSVRFVVIDGFAGQYFGVGRVTRDLDLWLGRSNGNARRLAQAFRAFKPSPPYTDWVTAFMKPNARFPYPALAGHEHEADLVTSIEGADFCECYERGLSVELSALKVRMVGLTDLLDLKRISLGSGNNEVGHARDRADIAALLALNPPPA